MRRNAALTLLRVIAVLLVTGCSRQAVRPNPEPQLREIEKTGYVSQPQHQTTSLHEVWEHNDVSIDISYIAPSDARTERFPLIVYLPGLGEPSTAGIIWRKAWAQAGYAVLSIQPGYLSQEVWSSPLARAGEFEALATQHFSAASVQSRVKVVEFAVQELMRRAQAASSPYANTDAANIVVAGFDLGAQTASILSGERLGAQDIQRNGLNIYAAIVISPFFAGALEASPQRFSGMTLPVLSVTGPADADPLFLVTSPSLRQIPWDSMPTGNKYLLVIEQATHAVLAGNDLIDPFSGKPALSGQEGAGERGQQSGGSRRNRRSGPFTGPVQTPFGESAISSSLEGGTSQSFGGVSSGGQARATGGYQIYDLRAVAVIGAVRTAFLDALAKKKNSAQKWLDEDAKRWLGKTEVLRMK